MQRMRESKNKTLSYILSHITDLKRDVVDKLDLLRFYFRNQPPPVLPIHRSIRPLDLDMLSGIAYKKGVDGKPSKKETQQSYQMKSEKRMKPPFLIN